MLVDIFDKVIELKDHYCQFFDNKPSPIEEPYINLYVRFKGCNASCKFCTFMDSAYPFDVEKFNTILDELNGKVKVRKLGFTGGEPTLNFELFKSLLVLSYITLGNDTEYSVNSNGINFDKIYADDKLLNIIDRLHISRHHYDDDINNKILGCKSISSSDLKELQSKITDPSFLQISCNLIKGYIDNDGDIKKMLEYANDINIHRVGLVSLMPVNKYAKKNFVSNDLNIFKELFNTHKWSNKGYCSCSNYIYIPEKIDKNYVKLYTKNTFDVSNVNNTLTFNGKNLVYGFDDNNIIY